MHRTFGEIPVLMNRIGLLALSLILLCCSSAFKKGSSLEDGSSGILPSDAGALDAGIQDGVDGDGLDSLDDAERADSLAEGSGSDAGVKVDEDCFPGDMSGSAKPVDPSSEFVLFAPSAEDQDGDGLSDDQESVLGTDPAKPDSDGDGFSDYAENLEGTDPLDPESLIYKGGWPYNPHKEEMEVTPWVAECNGGTGCACELDEHCASQNCLKFPADKGNWCAPSIGERVPRFVGVDQYGDTVDLYDFAYKGKLIALELSTGWCKPCQALERWFLGIDETVKENNWWDDSFEPIKDIVMNHEVIWVSILYESYEKGVSAGPEVVQAWAEAFPKGVPVLADVDKQLHTWVKPTGIPNLNLLTEDLRLIHFSNRGLTEAFLKMLDIYGTCSE